MTTQVTMIAAASCLLSAAMALGSAAPQQGVAVAAVPPPPFIDVRNRFGFDLGYAPPALLGGFASKFNPALWLQALAEFFSLDGVGRTTLGRLLAWKGDIIQPVALFALGVFVLYTIFK